MSEEIEPLFLFKSLVDEGEQFRDVERFEQVAGGAMPYSLHGRFQAPIPRNNNHLNPGMVLLDVLKEVYALAIRKFLIECDEVDSLRIQYVNRCTG
jgi:hypothetical protein